MVVKFELGEDKHWQATVMSKRDDHGFDFLNEKILIFTVIIILLILGTVKSYRMKVQRLDRQGTMFF